MRQSIQGIKDTLNRNHVFELKFADDTEGASTVIQSFSSNLRLSRMSKYVTGIELTIDGGILAGSDSSPKNK